MSAPAIAEHGLALDELLVRPSTVDDVPRLAPVFEDDAITGEAGMPRMSQYELNAFARNELPTLRKSGALVPFLILAEDELLGGATLHHYDPARARIEIGYWLLPVARGRGVMSRAVRALADEVFAVGLYRLEAVVRPENTASIRVLERVGFTREGTLRSLLRYRDGRADAYIYSLLAGE